MFINTLRVFGSYLSPEIDPLGDVDIELTYGRRITDQKALADYTRASGRSLTRMWTSCCGRRLNSSCT